ncbi:MAG: heme exporter protein CcmB [Mesorhizobium sp.]
MLALYLRDVRLGIRSGGGALVGVLFFLAVVTATPFAIGPDPILLARIGPAILWIGALLASLLGLDRLFQADRDDGTLDLLLMASGRHMLSLTVFTKALAHWTSSVLPLVVAAPVLSVLMNLDPTSAFGTALTLLVGTPAIAFVGAAGAAVAVSLPRGGLLVAVLILPLVIPVLIFGVSAAYALQSPTDAFLPPVMILGALTLFFAVLGPLAAGAALRWSGD